MGIRGWIEILTELENQLRDTSAPFTHDNDSIVLLIWRGSIRASFVPVRSPTFLSTVEI
jgi:hypothetical protein